MIFLKSTQWQGFLKIIGQNCKLKPRGLKKKNAVLNESSRAISQINYSGSFPELVLLEPQLRVPASKSLIAILHSGINWLFFKKTRVKKHNLNNYKFYMNLNK